MAAAGLQVACRLLKAAICRLQPISPGTVLGSCLPSPVQQLPAFRRLSCVARHSQPDAVRSSSNGRRHRVRKLQLCFL